MPNIRLEDSHSGICGGFEYDSGALQSDLSILEAAPYTNTYGEFSCGEWRSMALWNGTGHSLDTSLEAFDGPSVMTELASRLSVVPSIVQELFELDRLRYARVARLTPGSVLVPHRDYLELSNNLIRIHLPLETDDSCVNSDEATIYHMNVGEVWYLNATRVHSAVSGWDRDRTHLVLDFHADSLKECFRRATEEPQIPVDRRIARRAENLDELRLFEDAGRLMDRHNHRDFLKIAIKLLFAVDIPPMRVFDLWEASARQSRHPELADIASDARTYFLLSRSS